MRRGKFYKLRWSLRLAVLSVIVWFVWSLAGFHVAESRGLITASEAESITGLKLPPGAQNIRAAQYRQWIEYAQYLRFEAPVDVCIRYAATVVPGAATRPTEEYDLKNGTHVARSGAFDDFSWFDLDQAKDVVTADGGPAHGVVWVDRSRGVFYYRNSD